MPVIGALTLVARLVLAAVFAVAGIAKLRDRHGARRAVVEFGTPARLAGPVALALPIAELIVAGLLLFPETAATGAMGALALLLLFTAAIALSLARGKAPDCQCFGQLSSSPVSGRTLVRNGTLAGLAVVALAGSVAEPPVSAFAWVGSRSGGETMVLLALVTAAVALAVLGVAFFTLMRSYGRVLLRLERAEGALARAGLSVGEELEFSEIGLAPGTPIPSFAATTVGGERISQQTLAASHIPTLLLFTRPRCEPCVALMPMVGRWQREHDDRLTVVVASAGSAEEVREEAERHGLTLVVHDAEGHLADLFQASGTPSAVLLATDGTVASWVAGGSEWIEQIVAMVVGSGDEGGLPVGTDAPALELPSLEGETVSLESLRGRDTVLLFWNPSCGFCREMRDQVLTWETSSNGIHPRLVIVSSGPAESVHEEGFGSLVLLDVEHAAGEAFGALGTPMAVRLDAEGRVASGVAAGADAALRLVATPI